MAHNAPVQATGRAPKRSGKKTCTGFEVEFASNGFIVHKRYRMEGGKDEPYSPYVEPDKLAFGTGKKLKAWIDTEVKD